ncbi:hypothetical protein SAMN05421837_103218 [Amycolatopsis pretoriensis]|uniref:Uncharacterized protein n=1 Tax=Amycolatopsis pretoriensis TaxID=218821 RepID=A0A1H5QMD2_9PSEU|nr:hypothetical protein [Amycolatopsis pretoriensis]SEF26347.1 hypothetical protein SAMN05421837_103218 [Amycolatopsis pretoriensis]
MARRAPRGEAVTVAELLVRSATDGRHREPPRHREKPQALRSLARLRVFSVVAGALALTGGVATAVSMPVERGAGASWPPVGLEPPAAALVPFPADVVVPPAAPAPKSVPAASAPDEVAPVAVQPVSNSVRRGNLAKAVKVVGKVKPQKVLKAPALSPAPAPPKKAAPVRHEIPDFSTWWRGRHDGCGHHRR